jgi:hypothetical protein
MSLDLDTRNGFHTVDTHHIGATFKEPAPARPEPSLWSRFVAWLARDTPWEPRRATERTCCDGLCTKSQPCPAFAPGVIDGPHSKRSSKR